MEAIEFVALFADLPQVAQHLVYVPLERREDPHELDQRVAAPLESLKSRYMRLDKESR